MSMSLSPRPTQDPPASLARSGHTRRVPSSSFLLTSDGATTATATAVAKTAGMSARKRKREGESEVPGMGREGRAKAGARMVNSQNVEDARDEGHTVARVRGKCTDREMAEGPSIPLKAPPSSLGRYSCGGGMRVDHDGTVMHAHGMCIRNGFGADGDEVDEANRDRDIVDGEGEACGKAQTKGIERCGGGVRAPCGMSQVMFNVEEVGEISVDRERGPSRDDNETANPVPVQRRTNEQLQHRRIEDEMPREQNASRINDAKGARLERGDSKGERAVVVSRSASGASIVYA
ncbi:hypothetical protein C8R45DRAFT_923276 [Mycena sanguinolenta]|nr:hypothetical protein C8R45DRAFT_923276 [Mycena sanguinolenta]